MIAFSPEGGQVFLAGKTCPHLWPLGTDLSMGCPACSGIAAYRLAPLERDLDRSALEIEVSRELVVQVWKLAHRIARYRAEMKREAENREEHHA